MLVLPSESTDTCLPCGFEERDLDCFSTDSAFTLFRLVPGDCYQRVVIDSFDETVPQRIQCSAQRSNVFGGRDVFLSLGTSGAVVHDGASANGVQSIIDKDGWIDEVAVLIVVANAELRDLACAAAVRILMATDAGRRVVYRTAIPPR